MLTWIALLILIVIVSAAIISKLFVRSRIPEQGWFADPPRAATTLSVVGTMTAVLLAFVNFFSLQSYQHARDGASVEGVAVTELHDVADVLEGIRAGLCTGDLSAIRAPSSPMSGLR